MDERMRNLIKKDAVYAIVPARSGSKGVRNKNIRCLGGYPMMAYSIAAAKICHPISRVIVSTDSEQYAKIARYYGAETPFLRPAEFARDHSTDLEFMNHAAGWFAENENSLPEYFVHLRPTYPLRDTDVISKAIEELKADPVATSLRSAHLANFAPYKWFTIEENGYFKCLFDGMEPDEANNPRQGFPDVYIPDGYVDVLRTSTIIEDGLLHGKNVHAYIVPEGTDVDTLKEMKKVENDISDISEKEYQIYRYLKENYRTLEEAGL